MKIKVQCDDCGELSYIDEKMLIEIEDQEERQAWSYCPECGRDSVLTERIE